LIWRKIGIELINDGRTIFSSVKPAKQFGTLSRLCEWRKGTRKESATKAEESQTTVYHQLLLIKLNKRRKRTTEKRDCAKHKKERERNFTKSKQTAKASLRLKLLKMEISE
jgi:hypothetical protein